MFDLNLFNYLIYFNDVINFNISIKLLSIDVDKFYDIYIFLANS